MKMRWKADLPKMPRLPKIAPESGDPAPDALGPPPAPRAYREKNPAESKPAEYQAPSMLVEHRGLALLFSCRRDCIRAVLLEDSAPNGRARCAGRSRDRANCRRRAEPSSASAQSPIYVEAVPDKER